MKRLFVRSLFVTLALLVYCGMTIGTEAARPKVRTTSGPTALYNDIDTRISINNLDMFVYNDGNFAYDNANILGKTDGLYYPKGTTRTVVYSAGIWIGAKVGGEVRVAIAEYGSEFVPGPMANGTYQPDNDAFHVYQIRAGDEFGNNPDYDQWPVDQGAPIDNQGHPLLLGQEMTWSAFNDADPVSHINDAGSTLPLGVEIQHSVFGWSGYGALQNIYFLKYVIINKGGNQLDSAYVSIWADPDLGDASDDLVGCDTLLSLGYCYNEGADVVYGAAPPAVGFDFLRGPLVPGSPADIGWLNGTARPGYKNLSMTSFNKYINGTDPASKMETYGYMKGLIKDPNTMAMIPMVNPTTNLPTTFAMSGDPVTQFGWVDAAAADRRLMLSAGPFTMAPNDTQEVVVAVLVGQGDDPLHSITALRQVDQAVQAVFDDNFAALEPGDDLSLYGRGLDQSVQLIWDSNLIPFFIPFPSLNLAFQFEGFNIYQGLTEHGPWKKVATYDQVDDILLIYADVVNPTSGGVERIIVQSGTDSGLRYETLLNYDAYTQERFVNGNNYHFAVSGYYYDINGLIPFTDIYGNLYGYLTEVWETQLVPVSAVPQAGSMAVSDTAAHIAGFADAQVIIEYLDPDALTGHEYRVTFNSDGSWNLYDLTAGYFVLQNQAVQPSGYDFPIVDGMMIRVLGPGYGVKRIVEVQNAYGPVYPPDNVNFSLNSTGDWYMDPLGDHSLGRYSWAYPTDDDYEIRFTAGPNEHCFDWFGPNGSADYSYVNSFLVPLQVWNIGSADAYDPNDDVRISFMLLDDGDAFGMFDWGDGLYFNEIPYDNVNWSSPSENTGNHDPDNLSWSYRRFRFFPSTDPPGTGDYPSAGTVVRVLTNKPATAADIFEFLAGYACGDVDGSHRVDITDAVTLVNYIFAGGAAPVGEGDVNCDDRVNITDVVYIVNYFFAYGPAPCASCK
ncbi:MAG: dockerin type I repeat-containing protein [candidate division Zixibacteria bacterium]|nr:dockerin type I repeat-containing protein [candidate division Zixibacteria bacterium]